MVVRVAHVKDGIVANVTLRKDADNLPDGLLALEPDQRVGPGWAYANGRFIEPVPTPAADATPTRDELLAAEWELAARDLRAGKFSAAADALDRAADIARGGR